MPSSPFARLSGQDPDVSDCIPTLADLQVRHAVRDDADLDARAIEPELISGKRHAVCCVTLNRDWSSALHGRSARESGQHIGKISAYTIDPLGRVAGELPVGSGGICTVLGCRGGSLELSRGYSDLLSPDMNDFGKGCDCLNLINGNAGPEAVHSRHSTGDLDTQSVQFLDEVRSTLRGYFDDSSIRLIELNIRLKRRDIPGDRDALLHFAA